MAIENEGKSAASAAFTPVPAQENIKMDRQPQAVAGRPLDVFSYLTNRPKASCMSEAALAHLATIKKNLESAGMSVQVDTIPMGSYEAVAITNPHNNRTYVLIYDEIPTGNMVCIKGMQDVIQAVKAKVQNCRVVRMLLVPSQDYSRVNQLWTTVESVLQNVECVSSTISTWAFEHYDETTRQRYAGVELVVTNRPDIVNRVIQEFSPHTVKARNDYGFAIFVAKAGSVPKTANGEIPNDAYDDRERLKPLVAVSGYTQFQPDDSNQDWKLIPICTISDITTALPDPGLIMLALQIAGERFIKYNDWLLPYRIFRADRDDLGNLIFDENGGMLTVDDEQRKVNFLKKFIHPEFLALDYIDGRCVIPGMDKFDPSTGQTATMIEIIANFFEQPASIIQSPVMDVFPRTCGYVAGVPGTTSECGLSDSRMIDYLHEARNIKTPNRIMPLLDMELPPQELTRYIRDQYTAGYFELFPWKTIVFSSETMAHLARFITGMQINYDVEEAGQVKIGQVAGRFGIGSTGASAYRGTANFSHVGLNRSPIRSTRYE